MLETSGLVLLKIFTFIFHINMVDLRFSFPRENKELYCENSKGNKNSGKSSKKN